MRLNELVLMETIAIFYPFQISNKIAVKVISIIHRTVPATNNTKYDPLTVTPLTLLKVSRYHSG